QKESIKDRCAKLDEQVQKYQQMHATLQAYGGSLRALADSENADYRGSFFTLGYSLSNLAQQVDMQDPELGTALSAGANAIGDLVHLAVSARSEAALKEAI